MSSELIQLISGRPAFVTQDNITIHVSVHDGYFLQTKREWKRKLAEAHPDHWTNRQPVEIHQPACVVEGSSLGGRGRPRVAYQRAAHTMRRVYSSAAKFRRLHDAYERWQIEERRWYARINLAPPGDKGGPLESEAPTPPPAVQPLIGIWNTPRGRRHHTP